MCLSYSIDSLVGPSHFFFFLIYGCFSQQKTGHPLYPFEMHQRPSMGLIFFLVVACLNWIIQSSALTNQLVNGDAEAGLSGWTVITGTPTQVTYASYGISGLPFQAAGRAQTSFFDGGSSASSSFKQSSAIPAANCYGTNNVDGFRYGVFSAYFGGWLSQTDSATITITTDMGPAMTLVGPTATDRNNANVFIYKSQSFYIPALATTWTVTVTMTRVGTGNNDGYVDAMELVIGCADGGVPILSDAFMVGPSLLENGNAEGGMFRWTVQSGTPVTRDYGEEVTYQYYTYILDPGPTDKQRRFFSAAYSSSGTAIKNAIYQNVPLCPWSTAIDAGDQKAIFIAYLGSKVNTDDDWVSVDVAFYDALNVSVGNSFSSGWITSSQNDIPGATGTYFRQYGFIVPPLARWAKVILTHWCGYTCESFADSLSFYFVNAALNGVCAFVAPTMPPAIPPPVADVIVPYVPMPSFPPPPSQKVTVENTTQFRGMQLKQQCVSYGVRSRGILESCGSYAIQVKDRTPISADAVVQLVQHFFGSDGTPRGPQVLALLTEYQRLQADVAVNVASGDVVAGTAFYNAKQRDRFSFTPDCQTVLYTQTFISGYVGTERIEQYVIFVINVSNPYSPRIWRPIRPNKFTTSAYLDFKWVLAIAVNGSTGLLVEFQPARLPTLPMTRKLFSIQSSVFQVAGTLAPWLTARASTEGYPYSYTNSYPKFFVQSLDGGNLIVTDLTLTWALWSFSQSFSNVVHVPSGRTSVYYFTTNDPTPIWKDLSPGYVATNAANTSSSLYSYIQENMSVLRVKDGGLFSRTDSCPFVGASAAISGHPRIALVSRCGPLSVRAADTLQVLGLTFAADSTPSLQLISQQPLPPCGFQTFVTVLPNFTSTFVLPAVPPQFQVSTFKTQISLTGRLTLDVPSSGNGGQPSAAAGPPQGLSTNVAFTGKIQLFDSQSGENIAIAEANCLYRLSSGGGSSITTAAITSGLPSWFSLAASGQFSALAPSATAGALLQLGIASVLSSVDVVWLTLPISGSLTVTGLARLAADGQLITSLRVSSPSSSAYVKIMLPCGSFFDEPFGGVVSTVKATTMEAFGPVESLNAMLQRVRFLPTTGGGVAATTCDENANSNYTASIDDFSNLVVTVTFPVRSLRRNGAPTVNEEQLAKAIADAPQPVGRAFTINLPVGAFSDPDLDPVRLTVAPSSLPIWLAFTTTSDAAGAVTTAVFSGKAPAASALNIDVVVSDKFASVTVTVRLNFTHVGPAVTSEIPDRLFKAGTPFAFRVSKHFKAAEGYSLSLTAQQVDPAGAGSLTILPAWIAFDASSAEFSGIGPVVTTIRILVTATDGLESATAAFSLSVANAPPEVRAELLPLPAVVIHAGRPFEVLLSDVFTDRDDTVLSLTAAVVPSSSSSVVMAFPEWLRVDPLTRRLYGTPTLPYVETIPPAAFLAYNATFMVRVAVSDGIATASVTLPVVLFQNCPIVSHRHGISTVKASVSVEVPLRSVFYDPDGDALSLTATSGMPEWARFDPVAKQFLGTVPVTAQGAYYNITITASDGYKIANDTASLVVPTNTAPHIRLRILPLTWYAAVDGLADFTREEYFADAENDTLAIVVAIDDSRGTGTTLPSWLRYDVATAILSGKPSEDDLGAIALRVTATDILGITASQSVTLTVVRTDVQKLLFAFTILGAIAGFVGPAFTLYRFRWILFNLVKGRGYVVDDPFKKIDVYPLPFAQGTVHYVKAFVVRAGAPRWLANKRWVSEYLWGSWLLRPLPNDVQLPPWLVYQSLTQTLVMHEHGEHARDANSEWYPVTIRVGTFAGRILLQFDHDPTVFAPLVYKSNGEMYRGFEEEEDKAGGDDATGEVRPVEPAADARFPSAEICSKKTLDEQDAADDTGYDLIKTRTSSKAYASSSGSRGLSSSFAATKPAANVVPVGHDDSLEMTRMAGSGRGPLFTSPRARPSTTVAPLSEDGASPRGATDEAAPSSPARRPEFSFSLVESQPSPKRPPLLAN
mgnify:CR=1 FL=1